jgi:hypothetical protein
LAANIVLFDVLAQAFDVPYHTVPNLSNMAATINWQNEMAASTFGHVAYLLHLYAFKQRYHHYLPLHDFIPGVANVLSNQYYRHIHLTDSQLLAHFNSSFPQTMPFRMCHLRKETLSILISALSRKIPDLGSLINVSKQRMRIGPVGKSFSWRITSILSSSTATTPHHHPSLCTTVSRWPRLSPAKSSQI